PVEGGTTGLYETDGTVAGTKLVHDGPVGRFSGTADYLIYDAGGTIYRYDGTDSSVLRTNTPLGTAFAMEGYAIIQQYGFVSLQILNTETGELANVFGTATSPYSFTRLSGNRVAFVADN